MKTAWKRIFLPLLLMTLLLCTLLPGLAGCTESGMAKDDYGFERPKDAWVSDCLVLPGILPLEQLFGEGGDSGLRSEYAMENDGKLNETGTSYLVTLCYGIPHVSELDTYVRFVLVDGETILYDEECVEVSYPLDYGIRVESFYMSSAPAERLEVHREEIPMQGAVVIPFKVREGLKGTLYAYCSLESIGEIDHYYVDRVSQVDLNEGLETKELSVDDLQIHYLSEATYNDGEFAESDLSPTPIDGAEGCYMVLDLAFASKKGNDGSLTLNCHLCLPDKSGTGITLIEAPTGRVDQKLENDTLKLCATYGIPKAAGEQKSVRMILRVNDRTLLDGMEIFLAGGGGAALSGTSHVPGVAAWVNPAPAEDEETQERGGGSVPGKVVGIVLTLIALVICWIIWDELVTPVYFSDYFNMVLAAGLVMLALLLMIFMTAWPWWVITIIVVALLLLFGLKMIVWSIVDEGGEPWILIFSDVALVAAVGLMAAFTAFTWWTVLLVGAGAFVVTLIGTALIGSNL